MHRTRIKICGIKSIDAAKAAVDAGADAIGLVFAPESLRTINDMAVVDGILNYLPPFITPIGVVTALEGRQGELLRDFPIVAQVHGSATVDDIANFHHSNEVIRAVPYSREAVRHWDLCDIVRALLIDSAKPGSGIAFDHDALTAFMPSIRKPVILAGGLRIENVGESIRNVHPYAVDVSSGVESRPGIKDPKKIAKFCAAVREADELG